MYLNSEFKVRTQIHFAHVAQILFCTEAPRRAQNSEMRGELWPSIRDVTGEAKTWKTKNTVKHHLRGFFGEG